MFFRRYISGIYPLLVWAEDEEAADVTAVVHAAALADLHPIWRGVLERTDEDDGA